MKAQGQSKRKKLSKRAKLFLANGIFFVVLAVFLVLACTGHLYDFSFAVVFLLSIQCFFTFMSLIVYHLSIVADALNRRYKEGEEKEREQNAHKR